MFAAIVSGKADLADALFLIAAVLFGVAAVFRVLERDVADALVAIGLAGVALAWLVL